MIITLIVLGTAGGIGGAWSLWKVDMRETLSIFAERYAEDPKHKPDCVRDAFARTVLAPPRQVEGHTHASAAALRSSATNFASDMAMFTGADVYSVEMSKSDQRKGLRGSRAWYWAKDTNVRVRRDTASPDDLQYICDVDYYLDMPALLASRAKPTLLYSVVPEAAAGTATDDTSFCFNESGLLETTVAGGGHFVHPLWDYAGDSLIATETHFGVATRVTTYAVERRQVGYSRQLILLTPVKVFRGLSALLAHWLLEGKRLSRFQPIVHCKGGEKFVRFKVHTNERTMYTTARPGHQLCATVDARTDEAIAAISRLGTTHLTLPTVCSWESDKHTAVVLTEYHRVALGAKVATVFPVKEGVRAYSFEPQNYDADAKPKLEAFMSPLVHSAFAPVMNAATERQCVEGRINKLKKPEPKLGPFLTQCMREFVQHVVGDAHLEPVDVETVHEKQTNSAQKLSLQRAAVMGPLVKRVLKCFIKSEAYADVKDPRNISTYNDADKLLMSQFALAFSAYLKKFNWYAPGMTPKQIAERVAEISTGAKFVNVSDYHRMDGTVTHVLRLVDRSLFMKAFGGHRDELNELFNRNCDNTGVLPFGTKFEQGPSHGSGCPATSVSQTLRAAFTAYLAYRNAYKPDGERYSSAEAFNALGIHMGDDGLDADLPVRSHKWAADKVGLVLEAAVVQHGEPGVTFLARYYSPEVWHGSADSMCDIKRQLSKWHTTVRLPNNVTAEQKLVEKARGFASTDPNTPVIGAMCKTILRHAPAVTGKSLPILPYWARYPESTQWPNTNHDSWMDAELDRLFPQLDRQVVVDWLGTVGSLADILRAPLCAEPRPATRGPVPVVVDNDVHPAAEPPQHEPTEGPRATEPPAAPECQPGATTATKPATDTDGFTLPKAQIRAQLKRERARQRKATKPLVTDAEPSKPSSPKKQAPSARMEYRIKRKTPAAAPVKK